MGLLFYSFGLLPCVRVRCGLYSHGFTILHFWFAPMCESLLRTVSTWVYYFTLWLAPKCESSLWTVSTWVYSFTLLICSHV